MEGPRPIDNLIAVLDEINLTLLTLTGMSLSPPLLQFFFSLCVKSGRVSSLS